MSVAWQCYLSEDRSVHFWYLTMESTLTVGAEVCAHIEMVVWPATGVAFGCCKLTHDSKSGKGRFVRTTKMCGSVKMWIVSPAMVWGVV